MKRVARVTDTRVTSHIARARRHRSRAFAFTRSLAPSLTPSLARAHDRPSRTRDPASRIARNASRADYRANECDAHATASTRVDPYGRTDGREVLYIVASVDGDTHPHRARPSTRRDARLARWTRRALAVGATTGRGESGSIDRSIDRDRHRSIDIDRDRDRSIDEIDRDRHRSSAHRSVKWIHS